MKTRCPICKFTRIHRIKLKPGSFFWGLDADSEATVAVSQFRICILQRTRPLCSSKASPSERPSRAASTGDQWDPSEHFLVVSWNVPALTHTSRFLSTRPAKVMIYATQWRHFLFFSFFGPAKNPGILEDAKNSSCASYKTREKDAAFVGCIWMSLQIETAFVRHCDVIGLQMWPPKDAEPELRHIKCLLRPVRADQSEQTGLFRGALKWQVLKQSTETGVNSGTAAMESRLCEKLLSMSLKMIITWDL